MSERKLATIRKIDSITPIEGADKIVKATIGGWSLVTAIDNGFKEGDLVVYLEIDSWVPTELAPFLSKGKEPREYNGVKGEKLRTIKLRGQVSQGLILPIDIAFPNSRSVDLEEGDDVTRELEIQKWEAPMNAQLAGMARGSFPSFAPKTDQERVQNITKELKEYSAKGLTFEVTEKLEGSSMSVYFNQGEFGVCSRNINLKETEGNTFWKVARELNLEQSMTELGENIMIQGELIGPGIQGNIYNLTTHQFRVFDVYDIDKGTYLKKGDRAIVALGLGLSRVPLVGIFSILSDTSVKDLIEGADGGSVLNNTSREGLVFKCIQDPNISFKVISNKYLLKEKD